MKNTIAFLSGAVVAVIYFIVMKNYKDSNAPDSGSIVTSQGAINNVGNIRKSSTRYQGEINSPSKNFKSFVSIAYGYRAMIQLLRHYYNTGYTTLSQMLNRYAPAEDNNETQNYISFVSEHAEIDPEADIKEVIFSIRIKSLIYSMSLFEQGKNLAVNSSHLTQAYNLV